MAGFAIAIAWSRVVAGKWAMQLAGISQRECKARRCPNPVYAKSAAVALS